MSDFFQSGDNPWLLPMAAAVVLLIVWLIVKIIRRKSGGLEHALAEISFDRIEGLVIPSADEGEILIDYLLLTSQGLLILEVKDVQGTLFGGDKLQDWTVITNERRFTFSNPQPALYDRIAAVKQIVREVPVAGRILFLDEPTAGVDVELRKDMWQLVRGLHDSGVTIILTTHYIEEAEEIADRVGIISGGELLLVDRKDNLMRDLGKKHLELELKEAVDSIPASLSDYDLELSEDGLHLIYTYSTQGDRTGITALLQAINAAGMSLRDLKTSQSSLEEIFVKLVKKKS